MKKTIALNRRDATFNILHEYLTLGEVVRGFESGELDKHYFFGLYLLISNKSPYRIISVSMNPEKVKLYSPRVIHKLQPELPDQTTAIPICAFLKDKKYHGTRLAKFITLYLSTIGLT